jgi:hypothetical protein
MVKSAFSILAAAAVTGIILSPGIASAATAGPAVLAHSSGPMAPGPPEDTTVTFTVASGGLSLSAPTTTVVLSTGSGAPGTVISGALGDVVVTDDRALAAASWTAYASATDWTSGAQTIPVGDTTYTPGSITTTGIITATGTAGLLTAAQAEVVLGTAGVGNNTATWNPIISVAIPASAVGGLYTTTLTESVA